MGGAWGAVPGSSRLISFSFMPPLPSGLITEILIPDHYSYQPKVH